MVRLLLISVVFILVTERVLYAEESSVLNKTMQTLQGEEVQLAETYGDKVVLFVNVASRCGYTRQYKPLEELHKKYSEQGLAVVGVPCNQFGAQEPGTADEIAEFCQKNYGVTFDMLAKVNVNAPEQCDLYAELTKTVPAGPVKWNFEKFLVSRKGSVVKRYKSGVEPDDPELVADIERELTK